MSERLWAAVRQPVADYMLAVQNCFPGRDYFNALLLLGCFALSWWVYVPVHELLHVAGCVLAGGRVTRLELDAIYGAHLLQQVFPFISPGSDYAGRLSGFDTGGSDLVYLLTDLAPFLLTVLVGVPLVSRVAHRPAAPRLNALLLGAAVPVAYAPLVSLAGDYFEIGSILVSRAVRLADPSFDAGRWRGDDMGRVVEGLQRAGMSAGDAIGVATSFLLGAVLAWATLLLGQAVARRLGLTPTSPCPAARACPPPPRSSCGPPDS